jgi:hypothetical protein
VTTIGSYVTIFNVTSDQRISQRDEAANGTNFAAFSEAGLDEEAIHEFVQ